MWIDTHCHLDFEPLKSNIDSVLTLCLKNKVTSIIKKAYANIVDIKLNKRSQDFFEIEIFVKVKNIKHLESLMISLKLEERIYKIKRV